MSVPTKQCSGFFIGDSLSDDEETHYFLDSCFLCKTHLQLNDDLYMYRGDVAFCSEECRQEQIEIDEAKEKNKMKMLKKKLKPKVITNGKGSRSEDVPARNAGTVIAG